MSGTRRGGRSLRVIAFYTAADRRATFVREADEAVLIGPADPGGSVYTSMTAAEWSRYVKRMIAPSRTPASAIRKAIYEFLAYDQETRKDKNPSAFFW